MNFTATLISILTIHLMAAISPGPDFIVVSKNTLLFGRKQGMLCGAGVCTGIIFHIIASVLGLSIALQASQNIMQYISILGGIYLIFLGYKSIKHSITNTHLIISNTNSDTKSNSAFWNGFIVNILNPKAIVYFISLFSIVISTDLNLDQLIIITILIVSIQMGWYITFIYIVTIPRIRKAFENKVHYIERTLGFLLIALGIYMLI